MCVFSVSSMLGVVTFSIYSLLVVFFGFCSFLGGSGALKAVLTSDSDSARPTVPVAYLEIPEIGDWSVQSQD